jgi:hypothetical protein
MDRDNAAPSPPVLEPWEQVDAYVQRFEEAWQKGGRPAIGDFLPHDGPPELRRLVLSELIEVDLERRRLAGEQVEREEYLLLYPELLADSAGRTASTVRQEPSPPPPQTGLRPPFTLGQYHVESKIGQGGMGMVFRAVHTRLKKPVAIKVLPPDCTSDAHAVARFQREMEAIGLLDHPNIVRATDAGEASGIHFLVMDLVEGIDLSRLVRTHGPLPVADACELMRQAAVGLECAHEHGLVHRDIKPSNLLLSVKGEVKILDLGLALLTRGGQHSTVLTASSLVMGTADYMAPEQWEASHAVDIRADIYSLGCTLYTLLIGRPPFGGSKYKSAPRKMAAHLSEPVKSVRGQRPEVPEPVEQLLQRMTAKNAGDRPARPEEVADTLKPFAAGANLLGLGKQALERLRAAEKGQVAAADAVTVSQVSTADGTRAPVPSTRKQRRPGFRWIMAGTVLMLVGLAVLVVLRPWAQEPVVEPLVPGKWYDLLQREPIVVEWSDKKGNSKWWYNAASKQVFVHCSFSRALLKLGDAPPGKYDLEIEFSQVLPRGSGIFFRGRDKEPPGGHADALVFAYETNTNRLQIKRKDILIYPGTDGIWREGDSLPRQSGVNRLKITVGAKGLEKVFWNDQPGAARVCDPLRGAPPRPGAEGAFGVYVDDADVTLHAARLFLHGSQGDQ